ncbi:MAG TPA: tetratricopeptide repeat protein [Candidatus Kapabacteria bacterium]|nr:tetratricopeptide repeat protein [Candidatus Kapabacteria bacterium]
MKYILILIGIAISLNIAFSQSSEEFLKAVEQKDYEAALQLIPKAVSEKPKDANIYYIAGEVYLEMDKYTDAEAMFQKVVDLDKNNIDARIKLAHSLTLSGKREQAMATLEDAQDRDETNVFVLLEMANVYLLKDNLTSDDLTKAELLITKAREMNKKEPASFVALGDYYFKQRVYELAMQNYDEALTLNPNLEDAREKLAISLYWLGNREADKELSTKYFSRSLEEWNKITTQDPKNAKAFFEQGKILFLSKNFKDAVISLRNYVNLRPSGSLGRWYLAQSLDEIGAFDTAAYHLNIVAKEIDSVKIKATLKRSRTLFDAAELLNKKDNAGAAHLYQQSIESYKQSEKDTILNVLDFQKIGQSYMQLKDTINAFIEWEKAIKLDPNESCKLMDNMGYMYQKMGKYNEAIDVLTRRVSNEKCKGSNDHIAYYLIGQSYLMLKDYTKSIESLKHSISLDSAFLFARISLADAYTNMDSVAVSEVILNNIIDIAKLDTAKNSYPLNQSLAKLAQLNLDKKNFKEVVSVGEKWASFFPEQLYAYLYQAIANHNLQNFAQACANYKKVLKLDPNNETAKKNLDILKKQGACN